MSREVRDLLQQVNKLEEFDRAEALPDQMQVLDSAKDLFIGQQRFDEAMQIRNAGDLLKSSGVSDHPILLSDLERELIKDPFAADRPAIAETVKKLLDLHGDEIVPDIRKMLESQSTVCNKRLHRDGYQTKAVERLVSMIEGLRSVPTDQTNALSLDLYQYVFEEWDYAYDNFSLQEANKLEGYNWDQKLPIWQKRLDSAFAGKDVDLKRLLPASPITASTEKQIPEPTQNNQVIRSDVGRYTNLKKGSRCQMIFCTEIVGRMLKEGFRSVEDHKPIRLQPDQLTTALELGLNHDLEKLASHEKREAELKQWLSDHDNPQEIEICDSCGQLFSKLTKEKIPDANLIVRSKPVYDQYNSLSEKLILMRERERFERQKPAGPSETETKSKAVPVQRKQNRWSIRLMFAALLFALFATVLAEAWYGWITPGILDFGKGNWVVGGDYHAGTGFLVLLATFIPLVIEALACGLFGRAVFPDQGGSGKISPTRSDPLLVLLSWFAAIGIKGLGHYCAPKVFENATIFPEMPDGSPMILFWIGFGVLTLLLSAIND